MLNLVILILQRIGGASTNCHYAMELTILLQYVKYICFLVRYPLFIMFIVCVFQTYVGTI